MIRILAAFIAGFVLLPSVALAELAANGPVLLVAATETSLAPETAPSPQIADAIFKELDEATRDGVSHCEKDAGKNAHDFRSFLSYSSLPDPSPDIKMYFVRPSLNPHCDGLYGAHIFQYWLVMDDGAIPLVLHAGAVDKVMVLSTQHEGSYDLYETRFTASGGFGSRLAFDGQTYKHTECDLVEILENGGESQRSVPCNR